MGAAIDLQGANQKPAMDPRFAGLASITGPRWPLRRRWPDGGDGAERRPGATESTETVSLAPGTIARFRILLGPDA